MIDAIYELAKSASDNASSSTLKGTPFVEHDGRMRTKEFNLKLTFFFISIRESIKDSAIASRIINLELKEKPEVHDHYIDLERQALFAMHSDKESIISDNFRNIDYLLAECAAFKSALNAYNLELRVVDNFAPLLVFAHFFEHERSYSIVDDAERYARLIKDFLFLTTHEKHASDAEVCLDEILQSDIVSSDNQKHSVHSLVKQAHTIITDTEQSLTLLDQDSTYKAILEHLGRGGITLFLAKQQPTLLAIRIGSKAIKSALRTSTFASSYSSILRRHPHVYEKNSQRKSPYVDGVSPRFITFDLAAVID